MSSKNRKYCFICRSMVDKSIKFLRFPKEESSRIAWMNRLGVNPEKYKPSMTFCDRHIRAGQTNIGVGGSLKKKSINATRKILSFESTLVKVTAEERCKTQNNIISPEMVQEQNVEGESFEKVPSSIEIENESEMQLLSSVEDEDVELVPPPSIAAENITEVPSPLSIEVENVEALLPLSVTAENVTEVQSSPSMVVENVTLMPPPVSIVSSEGSENVSTPAHPRRWFRYITEITTPEIQTPVRAKRCLDLARENVQKSTKKIKQLQSENRYLRKKVKSLSDSLQEAKNRNLFSDGDFAELKTRLPPSLAAIIERSIKNHTRGEYDIKIRKFALNVAFYSTRAYEFLREEFNNQLPCISTLKNYYSVVNCRPGFTKDSFEALKIIVEQNKQLPAVRNSGNDAEGKSWHPKETVVHLAIDEVHIKSIREIINGRVYGHVNLGLGEEDNDGQAIATCALVVMAVVINAPWKVPLGFFLTATATGEQMANIVRLGLTLLNDVGVKCCSLTFDGAKPNIAMIERLGGDLNYGTGFYKPWFQHPDLQHRVYFYPDPSHMIKLVRNSVAETCPFIDSMGREISWQYISLLHKRQEAEGLHLANKLSNRHLNYAKENKMRVKLAVQVLSGSISSALSLLKYTDPEFQNAGATAQFCQIFNDAFDILNCRNLLSRKGYRIPLNDRSINKIQNRAEDIQKYIQGLLHPDLMPVCESSRKRGFEGFLVCLDVLFLIYEQYQEWHVPFLLTYKLLQDSLENFFSAIRTRGGHNDNPTCRQFEAAYKHLLVHSAIQISKKSNCISDNLEMLACGRKFSKKIREIPSLKMTEEEEELFDISCSIISEHDYAKPTWTCSEFAHFALEYLAGFVAFMLSRRLKCDECISYLTRDVSKDTSFNRRRSLIAIKSKGFLKFPSDDLLSTIKMTEKYFRMHKTEMYSQKFDQKIKVLVMRDRGLDLFASKEMISHFLDEEALSNHRANLIEVIVKTFLKSRKAHECKKALEKKEVIRHRNKKSVLFQESSVKK